MALFDADANNWISIKETFKSTGALWSGRSDASSFYRVCLKFDLTSLPAGTITSATLTFDVTGLGSSHTTETHAVGPYGTDGTTDYDSDATATIWAKADIVGGAEEYNTGEDVGSVGSQSITLNSSAFADIENAAGGVFTLVLQEEAEAVNGSHIILDGVTVKPNLALVYTTGPSITSITDPAITATNLTIAGSGFGTSKDGVTQSSGGNTVALTETTRTDVEIVAPSATIESTQLKYGVQTVEVTEGVSTDTDTYTATPLAGNSYVDLTSVATVGQIITTSALATGDQLRYENVTYPGGYAVTVNADATFTIDGAAPDGVYTFEVRAWDTATQTWGTAADQTVTIGAAVLALTGPSSTTENTATVATGTELDTVTTLILETDDSAYSIAQTIDSQTATTLNYTALTGVNSCSIGTPANGIPLEPTKTAAGITAYQLQQTVNGTVSNNITVNPDSAYDVIQYMTATANTNEGVSVLATSIIDAEDNGQFMVPKVVDGMAITWESDGTFTTDKNQTVSFPVWFFSPATKQWSTLQLTILAESTFVVSGSWTHTKLSIGIGI